MPRLDTVLDQCKKHIIDTTLPNWMKYGQLGLGGCRESLNQDWSPNPVGRIRLLSQCRQLYTWCHAALDHELTYSTPDANRLFDFIVSHYYRDGRWLFSLDDALRPHQTHTDAYALAFILLSFSYYFRLTGNDQALTLIESTHQFLQTEMVHPNGGYHEVFPYDDDLVRRQNPHMHLLEGYVAAFKATGVDGYKQAALDIVSLAQTHFFDAKDGTLREFFNPKWQPDSTQGNWIEPGHHFEWAWLLHQTFKISNNQADQKLAQQLWQTGIKYGLDPLGGVYNAFDSGTGTPLDREKRVWPITEYLKACCVIDMPEVEREERLTAALSFLLEHYLIDNGRWHEYLDQNNQPKEYPLAATTSYHLFLGLHEVLNWRAN
ncbi:phosphoheptose isomerase [Maribrevibacterium harenarium]|uniref:Phosphoheptose isomerase n=1 Tax=Maribrevibacterium harenarium TaxID=2589817 RepID=A0A501X2F3_9GAMM|nr:AGE family epimerase/isomerase [Maribrevibacterium harenarium]TPE54665.1 phosphoheptose isomerase [Maribrevibacterium harenarium]